MSFLHDENDDGIIMLKRSMRRSPDNSVTIEDLYNPISYLVSMNDDDDL